MMKKLSDKTVQLISKSRNMRDLTILVKNFFLMFLIPFSQKSNNLILSGLSNTQSNNQLNPEENLNYSHNVLLDSTMLSTNQVNCEQLFRYSSKYQYLICGQFLF